MIKPGIEKDGNKSVLIGVFNSGYVIALLLFLAGSIGSLIDVHIVLFGNNNMIMRVKDCSKERDPFAKYEYSKESDSLDNIGIKIVKSFAEDIKYSFISEYKDF